MEKHIENLNRVTEKREKMIDFIIYKKHNPTTDKEWDRLVKRYGKKSFLQLEKIYNETEIKTTKQQNHDKFQ